MTDPVPAPVVDNLVAPPRRVRVLIVEDHPDVGWLMKSLVAHCGYDARWVASSSEALATIRDFQPQIAILDIGLGGESGYELAIQLTKDLSTVRPVLVALTGHADDEHRERSAAVGFVFHLVKPVSLEVLAQVLHQCCQLLEGPSTRSGEE